MRPQIIEASELPHSIAAFFFFHDSEYDHTKPHELLTDKIVATTAYVSMLDFYNMTETDIPILQINRTDASFMDVSGGARSFLETEEVAKYRKHHLHDRDATGARRERERRDRVSHSALPESRPPWDAYAWLQRYYGG